MSREVHSEPYENRTKRRVLPLCIVWFIVCLLIPAMADTYSTQVSGLAAVYDYGPPFSYPRDELDWHIYGTWDPVSSYSLEESAEYGVQYYQNGNPVGSWGETFETEVYLTPVDIDREWAYTGRITAGTHKPAGATSAAYYYRVNTDVLNLSYVPVASHSQTLPDRWITFP